MEYATVSFINTQGITVTGGITDIDGNYSIDVPVGKYRHLTPEELTTMERLIGDSIKTEEASDLDKDSMEEKPTSSGKIFKKAAGAARKTQAQKKPHPKGRNRKS